MAQIIAGDYRITIVGDYRFTRNRMSFLGKGKFGAVYSGYHHLVNQFEF